MNLKVTRASPIAVARPRAPSPAGVVLLGLSLLGACSSPRPPGEGGERERHAAAGRELGLPRGEQALPDLSEDAALADVLRYAFLSNAELEQGWYEWRMALERVPQMAALDDPRLSFEYLFSKEDMKRWDRTTLGVSQMLPASGKLELSGKVALDEASAMGRRFEDMKFRLQAEVISAWSQLRFADERIVIDEQGLALLRSAAEVVRSQVAAGRAAQVDASKADLEIGMAENSLLMDRAERPPMLAMLNALLSRPPGAALRPGAADLHLVLPEDDRLLALAAERNPELAAVAEEVQGRVDALALAQKAWLPDFEIGFDVMGSIERTLMGAVNVPLRRERIHAAVEESRAAVRALEAELRARSNDVRARVVLQAYLARDNDRQVALLRDVLVPRAREVRDALLASYGSGNSSFLELLDAQRALLDLRRMSAQAEAARASAVAHLEALSAMDFGTLGLVPGGAK